MLSKLAARIHREQNSGASLHLIMGKWQTPGPCTAFIHNTAWRQTGNGQYAEHFSPALQLPGQLRVVQVGVTQLVLSDSKAASLKSCAKLRDYGTGARCKACFHSQEADRIGVRQY